jgi:hypothetical protein
MPSNLPTNLTQSEQNQMTLIADQERARLLPRNDYIPNADEYSVTNPDALADGDSMGRGTGIFLDVYNQTAGTREDITERVSEIRVNRYNSQNTYPNFPL